MARVARSRLTTSRRNFVGAAGAAALMGGFHIASTAKAETSETETTVADNIEWVDTYDVIVVGAGLAGLTAAATVAAEGDGATCLLLEKGEGLNGNSPYSFGFQMTSDHTDQVRTYVKALVDGATPDDVLDAFVDGMGESLAWTG